MSVWKEVEGEFQWVFIMDYPPCENIILFFRPKKDRPNYYEIEIKREK